MKSYVSNIYSEPLEKTQQTLKGFQERESFENFYRLLQNSLRNSREWLHSTDAIVMYISN